MTEDEPAPKAGEEELPISVCVYQQRPDEPRLILREGKRTRANSYYLLARYEEDGPPVVHAGPFRSQYAAVEALSETPVRPDPQARAWSEEEVDDA